MIGGVVGEARGNDIAGHCKGVVSVKNIALGFEGDSR